MAVPKFKRGLSKKQYFYSYCKIKKSIMSLLLDEFDMKERERNLLPDWLIKYKREEILKSLSLLSSLLSRADSFYPTTLENKQLKISMQERIIQELYLLHDLIGESCSLFKKDNRGRYIDICANIKLEVEYVRTWKKATNKIKINNN